MNDLDRLRSELGWFPMDADGKGDNLGIAIASYFERHEDRPDDDPDDPDCTGWGVWVLDRAREFEMRLAAFVASKMEEARREKR